MFARAGEIAKRGEPIIDTGAVCGLCSRRNAAADDVLSGLLLLTGLGVQLSS